MKVLHKRGFKAKRDALQYEREYLLKKAKDVNMGFAQFVECYLEDLKPSLKYNTYLTKEHIIRTKILPYFEDKALADICTSDIMQWQNEILQMRDDDGKGYSPTYLKTISAQMSAIFNHATRYYDLRHSHVAYLIELGFSPVEIAERMGHESISVTFTYSHLYPSKQKSLADKLNEDREKALEQKKEDGQDE